MFRTALVTAATAMCAAVPKRGLAEAWSPTPSGNNASGLATVHLVAHSHEDPGWQLTSDQYYVQRSRVIITNVVKSLLEDDRRVFHYVEMIYFRRWWLEQTAVVQAQVKMLVAQRRLIFLTGGLCMNDEATTYHGEIIDQMTWGHRFINATFGPDALPTVSWQIDAFGHSAGYAGLAAQMGLTGFIGQKINFQDQADRGDTRTLEFDWTPDPTNAPETKVLGHLLYDNTAGYSYMVDNITSDAETAIAADKLAASVAVRQSRYLHPEHVLFLFGGDFQFQDAPRPFEAMERIITYISTHQSKYNFTLKYSTPQVYFDAVRGTSFPSYDGDFFPATFSEHYVRSGFFTSRPAQKASDRALWARGRAAKILGVLSGGEASNPGFEQAVGAVDASVGVHQHHDAMSGTDFADVAQNYVDMMDNASVKIARVSAAMAAKLANLPSDVSTTACVEANISVCAATAPLEHGESVTVIFFNSLASVRSEMVSIPVPTAAITVVDASGMAIQNEVLAATSVDPDRGYKFTLWVLISNLGPLETRKVTIKPQAGRRSVPSSTSASTEPLTLSVQDGAEAAVDRISGELLSIGGVAVHTTLKYYTPNMADNMSKGWQSKNPCSSAYVFRPQRVGVMPYGPAKSNAVSITMGKLVQQVHSVVDAAAGIEVTIRVLTGDPSVHVVVRAGPLDISNGFGQEAILRVETDIDSASKWITDANGVLMMDRERQHNSSQRAVLEPEAMNYFPATSTAALQPHRGPAGLTMTFGSALGVASLLDGDVEFMLHRRLVDRGCHDDMGYQMDDRHVVVRPLRLQAPMVANLATAYRLDALHGEYPISVFFAVTPTTGHIDGGAENLTHARYALPSNVHLHTLRNVDLDTFCDPFDLGACRATAVGRDGQILLRLQHLFAANEGKFSKPAIVDIAELLASIGEVVRVDETSLTAAKTLAPKIGTSITMSPLQIRTFLVTIAYSK